MKILELFKKLKHNQNRIIETADGTKQVTIDCNDCGRYSLRDGDFSLDKWRFAGVITLTEVDAHCEICGYNAVEWQEVKTRAELAEEVEVLQEALRKAMIDLAGASETDSVWSVIPAFSLNGMKHSLVNELYAEYVEKGKAQVQEKKRTLKSNDA